ncbi:BamA/TamA family outer membrane protein [Bacteroidota bacterium]
MLLLSGISLQAQSDEDTLKTYGLDVFGYPFVFYTPETKLAFGLGGMLYFRTARDPDFKLSNIVISSYYTLNNQYLFNLSPEIYFSKNLGFLEGNIYYGKFVDEFYGFGSDAEEISNPDYIMKDLGANINLQKNISDDFVIGIIYDYLNSTINDRKNNPFLLNNNLTGCNGGISSGIGINIVWDTKNFLYLPTSGLYYYFSSTFYSKSIGGDFDFNEFIFDLRNFAEIDTNHIIATQFYGRFARGNPPFYELPKLGGSANMRGYYEGRYRDRNYITFQIEYKTLLFWKIGGVIFGGIGDVSPGINDFQLRNIKYSYGFGLRYIFDLKERLTVRADLGFGKNTSGVYFSVHEAF